MPPSAGYVEGQPDTLLRDLGCRNIVFHRSLVKDENFTGKHETCVLADSTSIVVLGAKFFIDSPYASDEYEIGVWKIMFLIRSMSRSRIQGSLMVQFPNGNPKQFLQ